MPNLALLFITVVSPCSHAAYVYWDVTEHWYRAVGVPGGISRPAANGKAQNSGGYLATITSSAGNSFIFGLLSDDRPWLWDASDSGLGPWPGGHQNPNAPDYSEPGRGWRWVTGEGFTYANWDPSEPNNNLGGSPGENSLHLFGQSTLRSPFWDDLRGDRPDILGYVVEHDEDGLAETTPELPSASLLLMGAPLVRWRRRRV